MSLDAGVESFDLDQIFIMTVRDLVSSRNRLETAENDGLTERVLTCHLAVVEALCDACEQSDSIPVFLRVRHQIDRVRAAFAVRDSRRPRWKRYLQDVARWEDILVLPMAAIRLDEAAWRSLIPILTQLTVALRGVTDKPVPDGKGHP